MLCDEPQSHLAAGATGVLSLFASIHVCASALSALVAVRMNEKGSGSDVSDGRVRDQSTDSPS